MKLHYTKIAIEKNPLAVELAQRVFKENLLFFKDHYKIDWDRLFLYITFFDDSNHRGEARIYKGDYYLYISINRVCAYRDIFITIAHELTHLQQYYTKKLRFADMTSNDMYWDGKVYKHDNAAYFNLPWEVEARAVARKMWELRAQGVVVEVTMYKLIKQQLSLLKARFFPKRS